MIYLDTCVVVYAVEGDAEYALPTRRRIADQATEVFAISPLVKMECLVGPINTGNLELQRHYEELLAQFGQVAMSDEVFLQAAQLRARWGLRTPDALHLAAAQVHRCSALWTNDDRLATAGMGLAIRIP